MYYSNLKAHMIKKTTDSSAELISLTEAKAHLRVDHSDDDTYISTLIQVVRQSLEISTLRALGASQTYKAYYQDFPFSYDYLEVPRPPLVSVSSVKYYDLNDSLAISHYYDTREPVSFASMPFKIGRSLDFLVNQFRVRSIC